jgi:ketosteroid isomerase-like protein
MCNQNEWIVREAFLAYDRGDVTRMMDFVDPEVDWTYRDPELEDSEPQLCHGRGELEKALRRRTGHWPRAQLEEVIAAGDRVMLVMRTPGADEYRQQQADGRTYDIVTVRDGLIVRLKACRDRSEARTLAGIG